METEKQKIEEALVWAIVRLRPCYHDSLKMITARPQEHNVVAHQNVGNYENLNRLLSAIAGTPADALPFTLL